MHKKPAKASTPGIQQTEHMCCDPNQPCPCNPPVYSSSAPIDPPAISGMWKATPQSLTIQGKDATVVKLSDAEYEHLEALRKSVVDEEKRLAVKYGASMGPSCRPINGTMSACDAIYMPTDSYEFHGQFLLIDKAKVKTGHPKAAQTLVRRES